MRHVLQYLLDRPLVTKFVFIFIFCASLLGVLKVQRTSYPQVDLHKVSIQTFYPGASPQDVENNVTSLIERELKRVSGIKYHSSRSLEGQSSIMIILDQDYSRLDTVKDNIQRAVDNVTNLPSRVKGRPIITEIKVENFPIYDVAIIWEGQSEAKTLELAKRLERKLLQLKDIVAVDISGERDRELIVQLDLEKINQLNLSFSEIIHVLKSNNIRSFGTKVESFIDERQILTISRFDSPEKLGELIVRSNDSGKSVQLKDIASIADGFSQKNIITRYNGKEGVGLWLYKSKSGDILNTVEKIKKTVSEFQNGLANDKVKFVTTHDLSLETKSRLNMVYGNIFLGLILVLVVLFIFFNAKMAFWVAMGIPFSLAFLWILMPILGITLNSISLCGIIIVLGMIVDDAIIVSESIYEREIINDESLIQAVLQVSRPIFSTIFTTIIAFLPIYFMPGMIGQFVKEIPSVVIITLVGSFIESLLFLPVHLRHVGKTESQSSLGKKILLKFQNIYSRSLGIFLENYKMSALAVLAFILSGTFLSIKTFKVVMFPENQSQRIYLYGDVKRGKTLNYTNSVVAEVEKILSPYVGKEVTSYRSRVGRNFEGQYHCEQCFYVKVELTHFTQRDKTALDIDSEIREKLKVVSDLKSFGIKIDSGAPPEKNDFEISFLSKDMQKRLSALEEVKTLLKSKNVVVTDDVEFLENSFVLEPDYAELSRLKVNLVDVTNALIVVYGGEVVGFFNQGLERTYYRVMAKKDANALENPLLGIKVLNANGRNIDISKVVKMRSQRALNSVYHYNGDVANTLFVAKTVKDVDVDYLRTITKEMVKDGKDIDVIISGKKIDSLNANYEVVLIFLLALLLIYFFLVIQFSSLWVPFIISSSIPVGMIGVVFTFYLHGMPISMMALLGLVGFSGVVINDALLMIEVISVLKNKEGCLVVDDLIIEARKRFTPIFLTTVTTIAGLAPSVYGFLGGTDAFVSPMVLAMGSGLLFGTISDLYLIPLIYRFIFAKRFGIS
ncbi:efflux RND transporter permease subunit [Bacteriovorax sp. Seq25_V]|uniref:efflux RND transporter permease subunit n=1 Tax=Bacteriovorax sp. Seq25_V TaxID=1201288 RepID=UPI00038A1F8A|nr:efflux RND transporter permease subunit [Bacteriovorax sp. Seq25_V]EQC43832.1 export membrane protein [Bacteriovorax sp. Seq25_V]